MYISGHELVTHTLHIIIISYIGVADWGGGRGARAPHPKFRGKYISGNYYVKFGYFSGKNHVKLGNFVNFSGKYHKNSGILIIFWARII